MPRPVDRSVIDYVLFPEVRHSKNFLLIGEDITKVCNTFFSCIPDQNFHEPDRAGLSCMTSVCLFDVTHQF